MHDKLKMIKPLPRVKLGFADGVTPRNPPPHKATAGEANKIQSLKSKSVLNPVIPTVVEGSLRDIRILDLDIFFLVHIIYTRYLGLIKS